MVSLSINSERPVLEIHTRAAKVNIQNKRPSFRIRHVRPVMKVNRKAPSFRINRLNLRAPSKLASVMQFARRISGGALKSADADIAAMQQNANIMNTGYDNPIAEIAEARATPSPASISNVFPPQQEFEWDLGHFRVEWTRHALDIEWDVDVTPDFHVEPHVVEVRIRNHPVVRIKVKRESYKNAPGARVDKRV